MPEIIVKIEYDSPEDPYWLNPDNVAVALSAYCRNTRFKCEWAERGNPWEDKYQKGGIRLCDSRQCKYFRTTSVLKVIRCLTCSRRYRDMDNYECRVRWEKERRKGG